MGEEKRRDIKRENVFICEIMPERTEKETRCRNKFEYGKSVFFWGDIVMTKEARERSENGRLAAVRKVSGK